MAGTTFTELFGESDKLCWAGGSSVCNQLWAIGDGAGYSIVDLAGSPPSDAGTKGLQLEKSSGDGSYIYTAGSFPRLLSGSTFDLYFSIKFNAYSITNYTSDYILGVGSNSNPATSFCAAIKLYREGTTYYLNGRGSSTSSSQTIALDTYYTCRLHIETGTNASYLKVGAGSNLTFTAAANDSVYITIGSNSTGTNTWTFQIGHIFIDSSLNGCGDEYSAYADFENGNDTDPPTVAILKAGTHSGNGIWTISPSPLTAVTVSTAAQYDLPAPLTIGGVEYPDTSSTRGIKVITNVSNQYMKYTWVSIFSEASIGFFIKVPSTGNYYYAVSDIGNGLGNDFADLMICNGQMYLETAANPNGNPDTGAKFTYTADKLYWVTIQYVAGGPHSLSIYDPDTWTPVAGSPMTKAGTGSANPTYNVFGRHSDWTEGEPEKIIYFDNFIWDYLNGVFPLLPPMAGGGFSIPVMMKNMRGGFKPIGARGGFIN